MTECKYKLPCGWCDKFDKECTETKCKNNILQCDHDWRFECRMNGTVGKEIFTCRKCGITKTVDVSYTSY